jgi:type IV secretory pathway TrbD component
MVPFNFLGNDPFTLRNTHLFYCFGRLKPGVSVFQAEADLKTIHDNLLSHYPGVNIGYGLRVFSLLDFIVNGYSMTIWLLAAAVSVLLIVSCLNVANLLFARGLNRRRELAPALKDEGGRAGTGGPRRHRIQSGLVTAQVALTCVLLIAAGLLIRRQLEVLLRVVSKQVTNM